MQEALGSVPGLGKSPGEGKGYPLQSSGLENSMDCIVHGVAKSRTLLSDFHFTSLQPFKVCNSVALNTFTVATITIQFVYNFHHSKRKPGTHQATTPCSPLSPDRGSHLSVFCTRVRARAKSFQSCPTLCDPMDCSPSGSSILGNLQARILEWVAMLSLRGSS